MTYLRAGDEYPENNRFKIVRHLGRGAYGDVYEAKDTINDCTVALKVLAPLNATNSSEQLAKWAGREVATLEALSSPHVLRHLSHSPDIGEYNAETVGVARWIATELLRGQSLDEFIAQNGPFRASDVLNIMGQICDGLAAAHDCKPESIVHRDLKPANIFVENHQSPFYRVKVIDWGLAYFVGTDLQTNAGGTPKFSPPEQDERTLVVGTGPNVTWDIWPLGLIAFELLTGGKSFWRSTPDVSMQKTADPLPLPSERACELGVPDCIPRGFDEWFARCVNKVPEKRFQDVRAVYGALEVVLAPGRVIDATRAEVSRLRMQIASLVEEIGALKARQTKDVTDLRAEATDFQAKLRQATKNSISKAIAEAKTQWTAGIDEQIRNTTRVDHDDLVKLKSALEEEISARKVGDYREDWWESPRVKKLGIGIVIGLALSGIWGLGYHRWNKSSATELPADDGLAEWRDPAFCNMQLEAWARSQRSLADGDAGTTGSAMNADLRADIVSEHEIELSCPPLNTADSGTLVPQGGDSIQGKVSVTMGLDTESRRHLFKHLSTYENPLIHVLLRYARGNIELQW